MTSQLKNAIGNAVATIPAAYSMPPKARKCTMPRTDILYAGVAYFPCDSPDLRIRLVEQMKSSNKAIYFFIGKCHLHLVDNMIRATMGAGVQYDQTFIRIQHKALLV